ncbi:MAG: mandelate racemase/muconate lactonizing enzyme family protein [Actinobacteria bacterium]|nr:mandelate racemase/muconate lactonizing enzyme family protein [Actinomycetota bacterium]
MESVRDVRVTVVDVPFTEPETWFFGRSWGLTSGVVEVETDDGVVGIGECPGIPTIAAAVQTIETMTPLLVGHDASDILPFLRRVGMHGWHHFPYQGNLAVASLEMAMWDIVGKVAGLPLHRLFGGLERSSVPFYWYVWVPDRDVETARAQAAEGVARGFQTVYLKIGFDLANDLALVRAVRDEVGPDIAIRVDANEAWTPFTAIEALQAFEEVNLEFLEQPIDMHDISGLAYLRGQTRTRIGANQSAWQVHQVPEILAQRAADVVVTDPHQLGGLHVFRDVAGMCEAARVPLVKHSFGDLGITTAATLHILGGLHEPSLAHQTHLTILEHDLLASRLEFEGGRLEVPAGPGIGVELDRDALQHYAELYESVGELPGYGNLDAESPFTSS